MPPDPSALAQSSSGANDHGVDDHGVDDDDHGDVELVCDSDSNSSPTRRLRRSMNSKYVRKKTRQISVKLSLSRSRSRSGTSPKPKQRFRHSCSHEIPRAPCSAFQRISEDVPLITSIAYYQKVILDVMMPYRARASKRGQTRPWRVETPCVGLGSELFSHEAYRKQQW